MLRSSLPSQTNECPFKPRVTYKINRSVSVKRSALAVEPRDNSLGVPDIAQQLDEADCHDELIGGRPTILAKSLQMPSGDTGKPGLVGLCHTGKRGLEVSDQWSCVILPAPSVLVKGVPENVANRLQLNEEVVDCVEWARSVHSFESVKKVDDDLADLRDRLGLELRRQIVAHLDRQTPRSVHPPLHVLGVDGRQLRIACDHLHVLAQLR